MQRSFPFAAPVTVDGLIDRRAELHQLHLAAIDGAHVRVAGPRRYGKTSLLLAHERALSDVGWRTVHVDLYGVTSLAEVCAGRPRRTGASMMRESEATSTRSAPGWAYRSPLRALA